MSVASARKESGAGVAVPWPRWIEEIRRSLPIRSQFVLSGNIRDVFLTPLRTGVALSTLIECLWALLESLGYEFLLVYDRVDGVRVHPPETSLQDRARVSLDLKLVNGTMGVTNLDTLAQVARRVVHLEHARSALIVDFASRISPSPQSPDSLEVKFYTALEKLSLTAAPVGGGSGASRSGRRRKAL